MRARVSAADEGEPIRDELGSERLINRALWLERRRTVEPRNNQSVDEILRRTACTNEEKYAHPVDVPRNIIQFSEAWKTMSVFAVGTGWL